MLLLWLIYYSDCFDGRINDRHRHTKKQQEKEKPWCKHHTDTTECNSFVVVESWNSIVIASFSFFLFFPFLLLFFELRPQFKMSWREDGSAGLSRTNDEPQQGRLQYTTEREIESSVQCDEDFSFPAPRFCERKEKKKKKKKKKRVGKSWPPPTHRSGTAAVSLALLGLALGSIYELWYCWLRVGCQLKPTSLALHCIASSDCIHLIYGYPFCM